MVKLSYWDTSCVLALYVPELLSEEAALLAAAAEGPLPSSDILRFEMIFALHAKEARQEIPVGAAARALSKFHADLAAGRYLLIPAGKDVHAGCQTLAALLLRSRPPLVLRTFDGIHIATALALGNARLLTSDKRMATAARAAGLDVHCLTARAT